jgi:hypothetical protein
MKAADVYAALAVFLALRCQVYVYVYIIPPQPYTCK